MTVVPLRAPPAERLEVESFYRHELGRDVPLEPEQEVLVARDGTRIVAALRLCPEGGTLILRTVVVARDRRGQGIGRALLREAGRAVGGRTVPPAIRHRLGDECIATYRAATA